MDLGPPEGVASSTISGQVTLTSGTPVANVTVKVSGNGLGGSMQTDSEGKYSTRRESGNYLVEVVPPAGYAVADGTYGLVPIQLNANEGKTVNFRLQAAAAVSTSVPPQARE